MTKVSLDVLRLTTPMALTALDIVVILLVGAGARVRLAARLRRARLLSLFAWFLAIVALRYLHEPVRDLLAGPVGTVSGASVLAFALVFGLVFLAGKLASRRRRRGRCATRWSARSTGCSAAASARSRA